MLNKGDKINNYTLKEYLGKGSYGEVWLAKKSIELSDDGILVALKFLGYQPNKDGTQASFINQVKREVGTWIKASGHKNIVSVQDGFAFRDDTFVIVSDFAEGGSLGDWLNANGGKSPSLEKTVEIMSEILDALTHLHSQNPDKIIHRDLKPDNILFKSGVPCITDFGVSRMSQTITQSMAQLATTSGGTPLYMSPESFNNQPAARSMDIWSAGVILYKMFSDDFPYYADNPITLALEVISEKLPKTLPPDVPPEFQAVVAKALEKDVSKRFQTAEDMKVVLKAALKNWEINSIQIIVDKPNPVQSIDVTLPIPIQPTEDWRVTNAENERQQKLAEANKLKETEKLNQNAASETKRRQAEIDDIQRGSKSQTNNQSSTNFWKWAVGVLSAFVVLIFGIIGISLLSNNSDSPIGNANNTSANRPANLATNKPAANTATTSTNPDTFKNSIGMEFVKISSGSFMMGSENGEADEKPVHKVIISNDFYLGKYEVTQAQWKAIMGKEPNDFAGDNYPVDNVSWEEAQEFIKKLNAKGEGQYRLPTEAEWEYSARAGTTGNYAGELDSMAWYVNNSESGPQKVGYKRANSWGLYDMHGNVHEWCEDWYGAYSTKNVTDPQGPASGSIRVTRGGGVNSDEFDVRSADRGDYRTRNDIYRTRNAITGFRLAKIK